MCFSIHKHKKIFSYNIIVHKVYRKSLMYIIGIQKKDFIKVLSLLEAKLLMTTLQNNAGRTIGDTTPR